MFPRLGKLIVLDCYSVDALVWIIPNVKPGNRISNVPQGCTEWHHAFALIGVAFTNLPDESEGSIVAISSMNKVK